VRGAFFLGGVHKCKLREVVGEAFFFWISQSSNTKPDLGGGVRGVRARHLVVSRTVDLTHRLSKICLTMSDCFGVLVGWVVAAEEGGGGAGGGELFVFRLSVLSLRNSRRMTSAFREPLETLGCPFDSYMQTFRSLMAASACWRSQPGGLWRFLWRFGGFPVGSPTP
jgi:hypothetical protein